MKEKVRISILVSLSSTPFSLIRCLAKISGKQHQTLVSSFSSRGAVFSCLFSLADLFSFAAATDKHEISQGAASMNVYVGSFCNPEGLEGLAHFLEHMLFYASEKYPVEDSYSKFIAEHNGGGNSDGNGGGNSDLIVW